MSEQIDEKKTTRYRKVKMLVASIMLILALLGMLIEYFHPTGQWLYWRIVAIAYAAMALFAHQYFKQYTKSSFSRQILLWLALLSAIYLTMVLVNVGTINSAQGALFVLILLALTTFIAGIFSESSFMLVGFILAVLVITLALLKSYLPFIMIPLIIIAAIVIWILVRKTSDEP